MNTMKIKRRIGLILLLMIFGVTSISATAQSIYLPQTPTLPSPLCDSLEVPRENRLAFRVYAVGVQIYRWNGVNWSFVEPVATLYADANYHEKVGIHYAGPTWEGNTGGKVVAARVASCSPDATAILWLLLKAASNEGSDIFSSVTYIQRVNTVGGLAPTAPGASIGTVAEVPYTTEYYFYRATK